MPLPTGSRYPVGILSLQGCVEHHQRHFKKLGTESLLVRSASELQRVDRLVIPGGESTTMLRLMKTLDLWQPLIEFGQRYPIWGICAGAILIAKAVSHPEQQSLGLLDIHAIRNFYGSQRESFTTRIEIPSLKASPVVDFIRAPKLSPITPHVEVLASHDQQPVFLRQGRVLASSFHIELGNESLLHQFFLEAVS